jgi:hypothetical protein
MPHSATASIETRADVDTVLDVGLTVEDMIDWFPLPIEAVEAPPDGRLVVGDLCRAGNTLAGRRIETTIEVLQADRERYALSATGPLDFTVVAELTPSPSGCRIDARIEARSSGGVKGRVLEAACRPLLGPGIRHALQRIADLAEGRHPARRLLGGRAVAAA